MSIIVPPWLLLLTVPILFPLIFFFVKWRIKFSYDSKIAFYTAIGMVNVAIFGTCAILGMALFNSELGAVVFIYPFAIVSVELCFHIQAKKMVKDKKEQDILTKRLREESLKKEEIIVKALRLCDTINNSMMNLAENSQEINSSADEITEKTGRLNRSFIKINKDTQTITNLINTIKGLSEQTNLLALNASIEAGRSSGEHGGFLVVAEKMNALSNYTKDQVKESTEKTSEIIQEIGILSDDFNEIFASTEQQGQAFEIISSEIERVSNMTNELMKELGNGKRLK